MNFENLLSGATCIEESCGRYTPVRWVEREQTRERARPTGLALQKLGRDWGAPVLGREGLGKGTTQPPYCTSPGDHLPAALENPCKNPLIYILKPGYPRFPGCSCSLSQIVISSSLPPSPPYRPLPSLVWTTNHSLTNGLPAPSYPFLYQINKKIMNKTCPLSTNSRSRSRFSEYVTLVVSKEGNLSTARVNFMCKSDQLA